MPSACGRNAAGRRFTSRISRGVKPAERLFGPLRQAQRMVKVMQLASLWIIPT